jgi:hypothetical protein
METQKTQNPSSKTVCLMCDFKCSNTYDYRRHILTLKHIKNVNGNKMETIYVEKNATSSQCELSVTDTNNVAPKSDNPTKKNAKYTCDCGKTFNTRGGVWKHKQKCTYEVIIVDTNTNSLDNTVVLQIIQQNEDFKSLILEQNTKVMDLCEVIKNNTTTTNNTMNNTINNNSNNKSFNLNVFLNETCRDAMNMKDFVDSIQITLTDIENMGKLGFVNGISNIIVNRLKAIDVHLRPVHCTDQRRETMYVKEKNQWNKEEDDNKNIRRFIQLVAHKNTKNLSLFKNKHPDCLEYHSKYNDQYNKIVMETFGGYGNTDYDSENKIIRKLVKELAIDKS